MSDSVIYSDVSDKVTPEHSDDMIPIREDILVSSPRIAGASSIAWLYLLAEVLIACALSCSLAILGFVKSILPKPPRDLEGNVVLVTGVTSTLGKSIADEFARNGCTIVCVDLELREVEETRRKLTKRHPSVDEIDRDAGVKLMRNISGIAGDHRCYECDLWDRDCIKDLAKRVKKDVGSIDVLVTCAGHVGQHIFEKVNAILMSHYWTTLAFLPSLMEQDRGHVVGVTPTTSIEEAHAGSRAAIAGLMESLTREFDGRNKNLSFITVSPSSPDSGSTRRSEQRVARDIVQAVRRDQSISSGNWCSVLLYRLSCSIHAGIAKITRWLYDQACDYP